MSDSGLEGFRKSLAFLVAINRYSNGVPELQTPVVDAEALAEVLGRDHGYEAQILSRRLWRDFGPFSLA